MEPKIRNSYQPDLFDESGNRCWSLPAVCRQQLEQLLTQLLIQAVRESLVIQQKGVDHASEN